MQRWVIAQNIARLKRQLEQCDDKAQRAVLAELLDREKQREREWDDVRH